MHRLLFVGTSPPACLPGFLLLRVSCPQDAPGPFGRRGADLLVLGPEFCEAEAVQHIRAVSSLPLLCLTPRPDPGLTVRLLTAGAEAVLEASAPAAELGARLRALLRRHAPQGAELRVAGLTLDLGRRIARYRQRPLPLTRQEFEVLACLARRPGALCSRALLGEALWGPGLSAGRPAVDLYLSGLRRHLRAAGAGEVLRTVRGRGWTLRGDGEAGLR